MTESSFAEVTIPPADGRAIWAHRVENRETGERFIWQWIPTAALWVTHQGELVTPAGATENYRYLKPAPNLEPFDLAQQSERFLRDELAMWKKRCDDVILENRRLRERHSPGGARPDLGSLAHLTETVATLVRSHNADVCAFMDQICDLHALLTKLDPTGGLMPAYVENQDGGRRLAVPINSLVQAFWDKRAFCDADPNLDCFFDVPPIPKVAADLASSVSNAGPGQALEVDWSKAPGKVSREPQVFQRDESAEGPPVIVDPPRPKADSHPNIFGNPSTGSMSPWEAVESIAKGGV